MSGKTDWDSIEYVEWVDSFAPHAELAWVTRDMIQEDPEESIIVKSVGTVVRETKSYIAIAGHFTEWQVGGVLMIPKQAIVKRKKVKI